MTKIEAPIRSRDEFGLAEILEESVELTSTRKEDPVEIIYPAGYTAEDDLDGDGNIDELEQQIKVNLLKDEIQREMDDAIKKEFLKKFRSEVDFHHRVAFRFEKAYQLCRKQPEKKELLNKEIMDVVTDCSSYLEYEPTGLAYLLFFCILYNN